jgi:hypothetical protein
VRPTAHPEVLKVEESAMGADIDLMLADLQRAIESRPALEAALAHWVQSYAPPLGPRERLPGEAAFPRRARPTHSP